MNSGTYSPTLIEDLGKLTAKADGGKPFTSVPAPNPRDFVSYDECQAEAEKQLAERHPEFVQKLVNGPLVKALFIHFTAFVAWKCAAEATRRAQKV